MVNGVTTSVKERQRGLGSIRDHEESLRLAKWYSRRNFHSHSVARRFLHTLRLHYFQSNRINSLTDAELGSFSRGNWSAAAARPRRKPISRWTGA